MGGKEIDRHSRPLKHVWQKPELVVLVRNKPERQLRACKVK